MKRVVTNVIRLVPLLVAIFFVRNLFLAESVSAVFDDYFDVVTDPAHMLAELTFVLAEALILAPVVAFWVERHDRRHHSDSRRDSAAASNSENEEPTGSGAPELV